MKNNAKPLISVIIPVYNGEKTIRETIESVLHQTYTNLELIVINDGSRDLTLNVISSIKDSRLKIFSYQNAGVCMSRNRGIERAQGQFISFLNADDTWTPDKLEAQLKALEANPQASVAYSWVDYIDEYGEFIRHGNHIAINGDAYEQLLIQNVLENGSNPLIRRQALINTGIFNESFTLAEDWDMWLRLAKRYDFVTVPLPQVLHRASSCSVSTNILKMETACLKFIEQAYKYAPKSLQNLKRKSLASLYHYLTFKSLESPSGQKNGAIAIKFLANVIWNDLSVIIQWQTMSEALFKICMVFLLPPQQYQILKIKLKIFFSRRQKVMG
ncbi:putative glycosyltransferase [Rivularia sp. PCC 7116]|uniref:glycosyltransferase n=1 Tax=Rivularia sp. PCC 7116 TaxID=373994 RepID=UPI00029EFF53|nr:glycosyltransferase [Rivularia sp. PCC 7116]AFY54587.1 putative glycosyltransferase [Rivularia sp. PCC 7116]